MTQIFLNYRATDDPFGVAMLDTKLSGEFGSDAVFLASKSIPPGAQWEQEMFTAIAESTTVLVIMGHNWVNASDTQGRRRLDDPADLVRREILRAFELKKQVIPVRLGVPRMKPADLPAELRPLLGCQDIEIRFRSQEIDVDRLAAKLREAIPTLRKATKTGPAAKFDVHANHIGQVFQADKMNFDGDFHAGPGGRP